MAALTRAGFESVLVQRCGGKMALVGMPTTTDGTNASLADPIRRAIQSMGFVTADPVNPVDADLASFTGFAVERLFDFGQLQLLINIYGNASDFFDQATGQDKQSLSQLMEQVQVQITALSDSLAKPFGPTMPGSAVGRLAHPQVVPNDPFAWPRGRSTWRAWPYPGPKGPLT